MRSVFSSLLSGGLILAACAAPSHAQSYQLTDLGILPGIPQTTTQGITLSGGTAVNNAGQVAGYATQNSPYHAFLSGPGGSPLQDLGTFGTESVATGVNNAGQASGSSVILPNSNGPDHAFLFEPGGGPLKDLGTLGGANSRGQGVNASGQVVGYSDRTGNSSYSLSVPRHAFLSGPDGGPLQDLGTLGGLTSTGMAVNDAGQVTGGAQTAAGVGHAFLSGPNGGPLRDLGALGGTLSAGAAVNGSGQVAGSSTLPGDKASHAFLSGAGGGPLQDLGALGGGESFAYGINASGLVVGDYSPAGSNGARSAFRFSGGAMRDLNDLILPGSGFTVTHAAGISDTGFITGAGVTADGGRHAFLLRPVAEAITAYSQGVTTLQNTPVAVTLAGSDPNSLPLTYTVTAAPAHGTLSGTAPNLTYTPTARYFGSDSFTFTVSDGANVSETATVSLAALALASLTVPSPVEGGAVVTATVALSAVTPVDVVVGLSSSDSSIVRVHRAVIIPAGTNSATFAISTYHSHVTKTVTMRATLGAMVLTKDLTITGR